MSDKEEITPGMWLDKAEWNAHNEFYNQKKAYENYINGSIDKAIERAAKCFCDENTGGGLIDQIDKDGQ